MDQPLSSDGHAGAAENELLLTRGVFQTILEKAPPYQPRFVFLQKDWEERIRQILLWCTWLTSCGSADGDDESYCEGCITVTLKSFMKVGNTG